MLLTDHRLVNLKEHDIRRSIDISKLMGISKNIEKNNFEFVVHVKGEYDYKFMNENRDVVIKHVMEIFKELTKRELPIFGVHGKLEIF